MQNTQLYIFLLIIAASALQWIFRKMQEQRAIRNAEQARERAKLEQLRTGRVESIDAEESEPDQADANAAVRTRLEELAERRRRQIEEIRRRQAAGGATASTTAAPPAPTQTQRRPQTPVPPRVRPSPTPTPTRSSGPVNKPLPTRSSQTTQAQQANARRNQFPMSVHEADRRPATAGPLTSQSSGGLTSRTEIDALLAASPIQATATPSVSSKRPKLGKLDRDSIRRAIVMNEVLGKPIALRNQSDQSSPSA